VSVEDSRSANRKSRVASHGTRHCPRADALHVVPWKAMYKSERGETFARLTHGVSHLPTAF
jgi:hypothetical protein